MHYVFDTPDDTFVWDVGHQAYTHKILTGRKDLMSTLRQKGGISGFTKRSESEHDAFGAGHASTSISAALGFAHARDKNNSNHKAELQVALRSLDSKNSNRDSNMLTYTEALDFPEIKFKSIKIIMDGDSVNIEGELSFHGVTNTINSIAKINMLDGLEVDGTFLINLNDYNIDPPTLMFIRIDDIIKIEYFISAN